MLLYIELFLGSKFLSKKLVCCLNSLRYSTSHIRKETAKQNHCCPRIYVSFDIGCILLWFTDRTELQGGCMGEALHGERPSGAVRSDVVMAGATQGASH